MLIRLMRNKSVDDVVQWKFPNQFSGVDTETLRPAPESLKRISAVISDTSIRRESDCCYTFDFPPLPKELQQKIHFFYAMEEKAYKACIRHVKNAHLSANYRVEQGYGHLAYSLRHTNDSIAWLRSIIEQ